MTRYGELGEMLRALRRARGWTRAGLAEVAGVPVGDVQAWELGAKIDGRVLRRLAERTLVPLAVWTRLRDGVAVELDLAHLRYARGGCEGEIGWRAIGSLRDVERVWRFDQLIYPAVHALPRRVYLEAARLAPELNRLYLDGADGVVGHLACLPLGAEAYAGMRDGRLHEGDLRRPDLRVPAAGMYLCSMHAAHAAAGLALFADLRGWVGLMGAYAVTADGLRACRRLGMEVVREDAADGRRTRTEIVPVFLERRIEA